MEEPIRTQRKLFLTLKIPLLKVTVLRCQVCGHVWTPRSPQLPRICAKRACHSPKWNEKHNAA
jgi:hypothetical protein